MTEAAEAAQVERAEPAGDADEPARDPRRWLILAVMCFALFMAMLDNTVVNVAIPTIKKDLNAGLSGIQWIIDGYTLLFASFMLTGGTVGDLYGRKKTFVGGLLAFAAGSLVAALAPSAAVLVVGRAMSGLGAAFLMPTTLAIITTTFDAQERPKAIGTWAGVSGLALAAGPILGGWMVEQFGWESVFWLNVPIGLLGALVAWRVVRESRDSTSGRRLDPLGLVVATVGLAGLVYSLIEANQRGWDDAQIISGFVVAAAAFSVFVWWELRAASPMLNLRFFASPTFSAANAVAFMISFSVFGIFLYLSLFLQNIRMYTPVQTGLRFLPMTGMIIVFAPIAGRLAGRLGSRWLMAGGMSCASLGLFLLSGIQVDTPYSHIVVPTMLIGIGMALTMSPMTAAVMGSVEQRMAGVASATTNTSREIGGTFGIALLGTLISQFAEANFPSQLPASLPPQVRQAAIAQFAPLAPPSTGKSPFPPEVVERLAHAGQAAFTHGIGRAMLVSATFTLLAAIVSAVFVRTRRGQVGEEVPMS